MNVPGSGQQNALKPEALILWIVFCFPIGLLLLWIDPRPPLKLKQAVTAFFVIVFIVVGIYNNSPAGRAAQAQQDKADTVAAAQQKAADADQAKAAQAKQAAEAKQQARDDAAQQIERQRQDKITKSSLAKMRRDFLAGSNADLVKAVEGCDDPYEVRVTVTNEWFLRVHQIRLQSAQNLWSEWAELRSPGDPGRAYIDIIDVNGNRVGGSNVLDGAAVKIED